MNDKFSLEHYNVVQESEDFSPLAKFSLITLAGTAIALLVDPSLTSAAIGTAAGLFVAGERNTDDYIEKLKKNRIYEGSGY